MRLGSGWRPLRTAGTLLTCGLACLAVAACGSSSTSSSSSGSSSAAAGSASRAKLVACLKQHGVTLPARPAGGSRRPQGSGTGTTGAQRRPPGIFGAGRGSGGGFSGRFSSNPKLAAAFKACGGATGFSGRRFSAAARKTQIDKFVTCVAQHGYKLPQPNLTGNGPVFPTKIESNAKFRSAARPCQSLLAPRGGSAPSA
jgi:hypothetical protein